MFYKGLTREDAEDVVDLWHTMFEDEDVLLVINAVKAFIATDEKGFPPHIGAIKTAIRKLTQPDEMTEMEAWGLVRHAIGNGIYGAAKEFEKLPKLIQRLVGSPGQLREWAVMDEETLNSVVASNFQRSYRMRAESEREFMALPSEIWETVGKLADSLAMPALTGEK